MKSILAVSLLMSSLAAFAWPESSALDDVREDICSAIKIDYKTDTAICTGAKNVREVLVAKVGDKLTPAEYKALGFYTYGAIDIGVVPDADTNAIFSYTRWLVNAAGKKVGVLSIDGWENYQMESRGRVDSKYNMKGEIVWIAIKDF